MESLSGFLAGWNYFGRNEFGMRARAARFHLFCKGLHLPKVLLQFGFRNKSPFAALAVSHAQLTKGFESLSGGHAADAEALGEQVFGGERFAGFKPARANFLEEVLVDLEVEGDGALAIEIERVHRSPQLYRQLGCLISTEACSVKKYPEVLATGRPPGGLGTRRGRETRGILTSIELRTVDAVSICK